MGKRLYKSLNESLDAHIEYIPGMACWVWTGPRKNNGYGVASFRKKSFSAHRAMYTRFKGEIGENMLVCHTCDNPWCVNPEHLFLGTPADNMTDKVMKNRQSKGPEHAKTFMNSEKFKTRHPRGERHGMSKLSDAQREEIVGLLGSGMSQRDVAKMYEVHQATISNIHRNWKGGSRVVF